MSKRKPWRPLIREEPLFNPFEAPTDQTRDLGANDRIEIPDDEAESDEARPDIENESSK